MGAIVGRVMGLRPARVIIPVILGSMVESFALTYASSYFLSFIPDWAGYVGYGLVFLAIVIYFIAYRRKKKSDDVCS